MGAWLRLEIEATFPEEKTLTKTIKIEVPTTKTAIHEFTVGETITVYFPSEFVIVFPKIPEEILLARLRVN